MLSRAVANREVRWQELTLLAMHFWFKVCARTLRPFQGETCGESATDVGESAIRLLQKIDPVFGKPARLLGKTGWVSGKTARFFGKDRRREWEQF